MRLKYDLLIALLLILLKYLQTVTKWLAYELTKQVLKPDYGGLNLGSTSLLAV